MRFLILPDMLKNAPMFKRADPKAAAAAAARGRGAGRGKIAALRTQGMHACRTLCPVLMPAPISFHRCGCACCLVFASPGPVGQAVCVRS